MFAFQHFLLGTHQRAGQNSNILKIAGEKGILQNIYGLLKDDILRQAMKLAENADNIIWWSPIEERSPHIMDTLQCIESVFAALQLMRHKKRVVLYEAFKQKHNSKIVEKYIMSRFDMVFAVQ